MLAIAKPVRMPVLEGGRTGKPTCCSPHTAFGARVVVRSFCAHAWWVIAVVCCCSHAFSVYDPAVSIPALPWKESCLLSSRSGGSVLLVALLWCRYPFWFHSTKSKGGHYARPTQVRNLYMRDLLLLLQGHSRRGLTATSWIRLNVVDAVACPHPWLRCLRSFRSTWCGTKWLRS